MTRGKVLIVSLSYNPGHISHVVAFYKLFCDLSYDVRIDVDESVTCFLPDYLRNRDNDLKDFHYDIVVVESPCRKNLVNVLKYKLLKHAKVLYVLHEPAEPYSLYHKIGYSFRYVIKKILSDTQQRWITSIANVVLLPSQKALNYYDANKAYKNSSRFLFPLIFDDESSPIDINEKKYFSYIGTIANDHAFDEYYEFVKYAIRNNVLPDLKFSIATKSSFIIDKEDEDLIRSGRLSITQGKPMSNSEINKKYGESIAVWNAYSRTMQSGVLAKSFMFGTPAIVMEQNIMPEVEKYKAVVAIDNNKSFSQIANAIEKIINNQNDYFASCRNCFEECFYYKTQMDCMEKVIKSLYS